VAQRKKKLGRIGLEKTADGRRYKAQEVEGPRLGSANNNDGGWVDGKMTAALLSRGEEPLSPFEFLAAEPLELQPDASMLELRGAAFGVPGDHHRPLLEGLQLSVSARSRVAVTGGNGAGKSLLLGLIAGELKPSDGSVWRECGVSVAYLGQQHMESMMKERKTPIEYMQDWFPHIVEHELLARLEPFGIKGDLALRPMESLSGGECVRVAFARLASEEPHLLVLDEPTSHLDIYSIDALTVALKEFQGGIIFASHNQHLIAEVADEVVVVRRGGMEWQKVQQASQCESLTKRDRTWHERSLDA